MVLVDGGSASASEIVTGALRDRKRATVVGTRTFGKGVFQEVQPLSNGGVLDITVGEYFLPKGENINGKGIKPEGQGHGQPGDRARRGAAEGARDAGRQDARRDERQGARGAPPACELPLVGVLPQAGRFLVAEPLFGRGGAPSRWPRRRRRREGDLVLVGAGKGARAWCAGSAGPTWRATCSRR